MKSDEHRRGRIAKQASTDAGYRGTAGAVTDRNEVRRAIEASHAAYVTAMKNRDVTALTAHFTDDAILLPQSSEVQRGRKAISRWFGTWLPATRFDEFSVTSEEIAVVGDTAYEVGTFHQFWSQGEARQHHMWAGI